MTYAETVEYLYNKLPLFSRIGSAAYKADLTNTIALCEALGNPQNNFKSIHVGGTNGKGSVSHALAAVFQTAGYKTGLYTSPHLYDFRERIRLNGEVVPEDFVVRFVAQIQSLIEKIEPSFFEITVAMAFQFFAQKKVDIAIIEVGLGGRLDSTNIIIPELSVITNIGLDHTNILGTTVEQIAAEKAGIIKPNVPVVIGETLPATKGVFNKAGNERSAAIYLAEELLKDDGFKINAEFLQIKYRDKDGEAVLVETDLAGLYQVKNVRTVLAAISVLQPLGWNLPGEGVLSALKKVKKLTGLTGRWDVVHSQPTIVLDVAHNADGVKQTLLHIRQLTFTHLHIVIGMVKDKEIEGVLELLPRAASYYFTQAHIPRALPAQELQQKGELYNLSGGEYEDVNTALRSAVEKAGTDDLILVCGSIFLIAEVRISDLNSTTGEFGH
ncbi:MAG TPA: folylpolyglutamate synthase/dihydrofolate synthase family protein [Flavisolibacter sp.]|nr:folylpolyglutamate synthase/dihydrofolate synthase family protein [Flavisolibacter sp.]